MTPPGAQITPATAETIPLTLRSQPARAQTDRRGVQLNEGHRPPPLHSLSEPKRFNPTRISSPVLTTAPNRQTSGIPANEI